MTDVSHDLTIVDSSANSTSEMDMMNLGLINIMIGSGAMNALLGNAITPGRTSIPKHKNPEGSTPLKTSKKKLKMNAAASRDKLSNMRDSDISSLGSESDTQSLISSQE